MFNQRLYLGRTKEVGSRDEENNNKTGDSAKDFIQNEEVLERIRQLEHGRSPKDEYTDNKTHKSGKLSSGAEPSSRKTTKRTKNAVSKQGQPKLEIDQFLERNKKWINKREENVNHQRKQKEDVDMEECTFTPETHEYEGERPSDPTGLDSTTDYKMVFGGKTFDLSSGSDLKNLFQHSLEKSGQRSIFRKNYDKLNKIYSTLLK